MNKFNVVKLVKVLGLVLSVGGTIATGWAGTKETHKALEKLVDERLSSK